MKTYDHLILGGGAVGLAIAFRLAKTLKNSKIAVIDYHTGSAASRAAGAMLGCFGEVTKYTFSHEANREKFKLTYDAHNKWDEWRSEIEMVSGEKVWHKEGTHIILNTQGGDLDEDNYEAIISTLKEFNEPFEEINPKNIKGLDPSPLAKPLRTLYIQEGAIDSNQYLQVLRTACEKLNIEFINGKVDQIISSGNQYIAKGDFEEVSSENIILATGAFSNELLKNSELGLSIMPLFAGVGFAMVMKTYGQAFEHTIRGANRSGSCGLHLVPLEEREYIGATNVIYATPQNQAIAGMNLFLTSCAIDQLKRDIFSSNVEEYRIGNRPISLDTFPLIGKTSLKGFFVATGTYRDGFHCSPVIADNIVNEIVGEKRIISEMFNPERKPIQTLTQEESIKDFAQQSLSGAYEFWLKLPGIIKEKDMITMYEQQAKNIYKKLGIKGGINTDILFCLSMQTPSEDSMLELTEYLQKNNL